MDNIELNDDELLKKFNMKSLEMSEKELINVKYYSYYCSDTNYIYFDIEHKVININTRISDIKELKCIMEIGKKLNILKEEE